MLVLWSLGAATVLPAQSPPVHYLHHGVMPPGAIGGWQLQRGGPLPGFFQPVEIKVPQGALVSLAVDGNFEKAQPGPRKAGLLIGGVYRLRVANLRLADEHEVFPTIEVIDRLYAPPDQQSRFAIPIDITPEDLRLALEGKFVTRVIYLEDPHQALPARDPQSRNWFEAAPGQDPLAVADGLGRPVAILRLGARLPSQDDMQDPSFFYGSPPFMPLRPEPASAEVENLPPPPEMSSSGDGASAERRRLGGKPPSEVSSGKTPRNHKSPPSDPPSRDLPSAPSPSDNAAGDESAIPAEQGPQL
jgi:hypothetical protein